MIKTFNKGLCALAVAALFAACAEDKVADFKVDMPAGMEKEHQYDGYDAIKNYVDRAKYPNFKISAALGAADFNERGLVYAVATTNFDEVATGNAMKMASVVDSETGAMNFKTITDFLDNTEAAGLSVYGHTLAWHAQQPKAWLTSLMADVKYPHTPDYEVLDGGFNFAEMTEYPFEVLTKGLAPIFDGEKMIVPHPGGNTKYYVAQNVPTIVGNEYEVAIEVKADKDASVAVVCGSYNEKIYVSGEWSTFKLPFKATEAMTSVLFNPARTKMQLEFKSVRIYHYYERTLSPEEKKDTLAWAMQTWCNGMMEACAGRVKAWDMINEAISGGGNVNGYYDLQHADGGSNNDFFWQDYVGSENYGPIVEKAARQAWAANGGDASELKLFVNDYNLESDWDDNKKLKSLIYWVGVWEKNGAKIDGLGSQMHISYYENEATMKSKAAHVVKMLHLMAESGKLVRISELDMGYVDKAGNSINTEYLSDKQRQNMANYYRFIIQMYLKIVPQAQQYGICQWCLTDAPASSGWRGGEPVGLWTIDWRRTASYAAYCEALSTPIPETEDFFEYIQKIN